MKQQSSSDILKQLRNLGTSAYKFLHECEGHPGILFCGSVEEHINEMWRLWHLLDGTWDEPYRFTESHLTKTCEEMRNKPIRTKGKIFPLKSANTLCDQLARIRALAWSNTFGGEKNPHFKKAMEISQRYGDNMAKTKEWKDAFQEGYKRVQSTNYLGCDVEAEAITAGYGNAYAIKFPKSVYAQ